MTEEEMAKEYAKLNARQYIHNDGAGFCTSEEEVKRAFLAGRNSKTQWHDLRKNPDDLPKENTLVLSDKGMLVMWRGFSWAEYSPNYDNIKLRKWEEPATWCEIPKYTEE